MTPESQMQETGLLTLFRKVDDARGDDTTINLDRYRDQRIDGFDRHSLLILDKFLRLKGQQIGSFNSGIRNTSIRCHDSITLGVWSLN